jgi:uncharacterized membrane protein YhaH (DUF805 family)
MADVFISYAREDQPRAEQIARGLQALGHECFWDTEIPPGQTWADYIEGKLSACKAVIVLWSEHSTGSAWVREEARMGRDRGKLIPAMLDNSPAPFGFGEVQAANLSTWRGEPNHADWVRLASAVDAAVRGPNAAPRPAPQPAAAPQPQPQPQPQPRPAPPPQPQFAAAGAAASGGDQSPVGYIAKCLRLYVNGNGRARRAEYGWFLLFGAAVGFVAGFLDAALFGINPYTGQVNYALTIIASLGLICPAVSAASRRAHDFGQTGWLAALTVIPYLGLIAALVFVFIPGAPGENKYGPNPKGV